MQLLEISKDSIESFPVTYNNRIINHPQHFLAFMILLETEDLVQLLFSSLFSLFIKSPFKVQGKKNALFSTLPNVWVSVPMEFLTAKGIRERRAASLDEAI